MKSIDAKLIWQFADFLVGYPNTAQHCFTPMLSKLCSLNYGVEKTAFKLKNGIPNNFLQSIGLPEKFRQIDTCEGKVVSLLSE